ncbi:MAG: NAD-dependent epimerase [Ignavibacteria bacterium]|nr:NAD-dependent epimerase [Ignavibacteria bacterium]
MKYLITGTAGFIGFHVAKKILQNGDYVLGLDNINDYYDVEMKYARLNELGLEKKGIKHNKILNSKIFENHQFINIDLEDRINVEKVFKKIKFDIVINLAAQPGVRYSLVNPYRYVNSNLNGFLNILESCRHNPVKHLIFASSSSVYGLNKKMPFSVQDNVDHPISLYAASKKSNELMAHTYSYLFNFPVTGLRFFTVYGPWNRPDMAVYLFSRAIMENKTINVYNFGNMWRDFTYVADIVDCILKVVEHPPKGNSKWLEKDPDPSSSIASYKIYNVGNNTPVKITDVIELIEKGLGKKAKINFQPLQPGEVTKTFADIDDLKKDFDFIPKVSFQEGIKQFISWFKSYHIT